MCVGRGGVDSVYVCVLVCRGKVVCVSVCLVGSSNLPFLFLSFLIFHLIFSTFLSSPPSVLLPLLLVLLLLLCLFFLLLLLPPICFSLPPSRHSRQIHK